MHPSRLTALRIPWTALIVVLALLSTVAHVCQVPMVDDLLACHRKPLLAGQLWRLLTGPLVHADLGHAVRDLAGLLLLGLLLEQRLKSRFVWALLMSTVVAPAAALMASPSMVTYYGLSGTEHGLVGAGLAWIWRQAGWRPSLWIKALTVGVLLKLIFECLTGELLLSMQLPRGVFPAPVAHLAGTLCGCLCVCLWVSHQAINQARSRSIERATSQAIRRVTSQHVNQKSPSS